MTLDLDGLNPKELEELAWAIRQEAERRRRHLSVEAAFEAWRQAPLSERGERSPMADVLRVRNATSRLIHEYGWRPEQVVAAMTEVALHVSPDRGVAEEAVAAGIADGRS
jgi:hypothetical protein